MILMTKKILSLKKKRGQKRKGIEGPDNETEKESRKLTKTNEVEDSQTSDDDDDEEEGDEVEDLKLEDLESGPDSDSDIEMDDEFHGKASGESDQSDENESDENESDES